MIELIRTFQANVLLFGLLLIRVSAMFTLAPIFNSRVVPAKIRAAAAVMLSMATLPMLADGTLRMPDSMLAYAILGAKEVIIGALIGLIAQLLFASVQLAGSLIDTGAGFSIGQSLDPTSNLNLSTMGRAYSLFASTAFVALGGHLVLIQALVASFRLVPPTRVPNILAVTQGVMAESAGMFVIGLQIAAPLMAALLITDVALGIMSRAAPQMNVFIVGLPLKSGVALLGTALLLSSFVTLLNGLTDQMFQNLSSILKAAGGG